MRSPETIEYLRELQRQGTVNILIFAAPLAILLSNLGLVLQLQDFAIQVLVSVGTIALLVGFYRSAVLKDLVSFMIIREHSSAAIAQGDLRSKTYLAYIESIFRGANLELGEDGLLVRVRKDFYPTIVCIWVGYGALLLVLLIAVWR